MLGPLVKRCLDDFAHEFERRKIDARNAVPSELPAVRGDAMLLAQVMRTLLSNAAEALGAPGGRIDVQAQAEGGRRGTVQLEVRDSGPGMSAEQLARVGRPFYTTKARGLGVGLAMAKRVVERAGGQLEIESAPGSGTVVRLRLATA
jgi:two-component system, NtrC family, sensor histidine kinase HydH